MPDLHKISFSLIDEPWILVRFLNGEIEELSIREVFTRAIEIQDIVGELPTQTFTITRLLLAILLGSLRPIVEPVAEWQRLWDSRDSLNVVVGDYLQDFRDRFDLLHPSEPFYQVADLHTATNEISSLDKLIADVPNGNPFFTTRLKRGIESISLAEASRWLVHCQAFDPSGIKSGAVGGSRVKGGKGYPIGTAWAGSLGGVLVDGKNLRETLLLNLVLATPTGEPISSGDLPTWERKQLTSAVEGNGARSPVGQADLFTWQSRRIRLIRDGTSVTGVVIANGDPLKPQHFGHIQNIEPMTSWRRSEPQEKIVGRQPVYMPKMHDPDRAMWRGLAALLPQGDRDRQSKEGSKTLPPLSLNWVRHLQAHGALMDDFVLHTRAIGIKYGSQSATVDEIVDDAVSMHSALIAESGQELAIRVLDAVTQTDGAVAALGRLSGDLAEAKGGDPDGSRARIQETAYFALDTPFRKWLAHLDVRSDIVAELDNWFGEARTLLRRLATEAVDEEGPAAWIGRENSKGRHMSSSEAFGWFLGELNKTLALSSNLKEEKLVKNTMEVVQ